MLKSFGAIQACTIPDVFVSMSLSLNKIDQHFPTWIEMYASYQ